jgi:CheY-like chemotaxis protein
MWQMTVTDAMLVIAAVLAFGVVVWRTLTGPSPPPVPVEWRRGRRTQKNIHRADAASSGPESFDDSRLEERTFGQQAASPIVPPKPGHYQSALTPISVLLVEDDEDSRQMLTNTLEYYGARVVAVSSADEALTTLETHHADVLLSDLRLPEKDGFALIDELRGRSDSALATIPAASITAARRTEDRRDALAAGYQVHMEKPVDPDDLVATVLSLATMPRDEVLRCGSRKGPCAS